MCSEKIIAGNYTWRRLSDTKTQPKGIALPIQQTIDKLVQKRADEIAEGFTMERRTEVLELLEIKSDELRYYHNHYWSMFKWLLAFSFFLLVIPFTESVFNFVLNKDDMSSFKIYIPHITLLVSAVSLILIKNESTKVQSLQSMARILYTALDERYDNHPKEYYTRQPVFYYCVQYEPMNFVIWFFMFIAAATFIEEFLFLKDVYMAYPCFFNYSLILPFALFLLLLFFMLFMMIYFQIKFRAEKKKALEN